MMGGWKKKSGWIQIPPASCVPFIFPFLFLSQLSVCLIVSRVRAYLTTDQHFDCHMLLFAIRYVTLNINKLDFDKNKACFVASMVVSLYTPNYLAHVLRRQQIYSSFTGHVCVMYLFHVFFFVHHP